MPFNPYRQYRVPDHLNRSRFPVNMPQQQARPAPVPVQSTKRWTNAVAVTSTNQPRFSAIPSSRSTNTYIQVDGIPKASPESVLRSTELEASYFPTCLSPEDVDPNDLWNQAINFDAPISDFAGFGDLGLGLEALDNTCTRISTTFKSADTDILAYATSMNEFDSIDFEAGSPDRQSSLSESSGGFLSDITDFPDVSNESDMAAYNTEMSAALDSFSPFDDTTPKPPFHSFSKHSSRYATESSPRPRYRASPYPTNPGRGRSFSTGSVAFPRTRHSSPYIHKPHQSLSFASQQASPSIASIGMPPLNDVDFDMYCQSQESLCPTSQFDDTSLLLPQSITEHSHETRSSSISECTEIVNFLQSSTSARSKCEHHFADSSEPPDLFGPLEEEQLSPSPGDLECDDENTPRGQELRFEGDMYTPKYVRGHGNKREGWCGICKPGRWLVLKNSAFWYDKSFTHGISAATGTAFEGPTETRRMKGNPDVWEGLCSTCGDWIALISSKKKGTTWFRHAYKCHTHQKVKDTPKRRREVTHARAPKASKTSKVKPEVRDDSPCLLESPVIECDNEVGLYTEGSSAH